MMDVDAEINACLDIIAEFSTQKNDHNKTPPLTMGWIVAHLVFIAALIALWETSARLRWVDPLMIGKPSDAVGFLWEGFVTERSLWKDIGYTLFGTFASFVLGSTMAILTGLMFVTWPATERFATPYLTLLNAIPRIALAPLFLLWFAFVALTATYAPPSRIKSLLRHPMLVAVKACEPAPVLTSERAPETAPPKVASAVPLRVSVLAAPVLVTTPPCPTSRRTR
mgnify:CR=1 FL=1